MNLRLIPARAGNTDVEPTCTCAPKAHPRSRGEHTAAKIKYNPMTGSSPLARGTPRFVLRVGASFRLIPARAGNTATFIALL